MHRIRSRFLTRLTAIALLAIATGQLALAAHAVAGDHGFGERCEVCLGGERLAHALAPGALAVESPAAGPAAAVAVMITVAAAVPARQHARAPPIL